MATHSGIPGVEILSFDDDQIHPIDYEDTDGYQVTKECRKRNIRYGKNYG
ncbi:MAG: hypothetical protein K6G03_07635 [Lachnospiraceae bacterium]|nr:hypothetical protein [Lachnospiraceae bacterium]